jgi:PBP1b-binding outer membrane lipoprotein LpoB
MSHRRIVAVIAAVALLLSGCGGSNVTSNSPTAKSSAETSSSEESTSEEHTSTEAEPQETLDPSACTDVTGANLDLAVANTAEDAQKAADIFAKYNPPPDVQEAIDHFVGTEGAQFDDPDYGKFNSRIDEWVKGICPL